MNAKVVNLHEYRAHKLRTDTVYFVEQTLGRKLSERVRAYLRKHGRFVIS